MKKQRINKGAIKRIVELAGDDSLSEKEIYRAIRLEVECLIKQRLTKAIEIFKKQPKDEPMTANVVNLELKMLRGDYD